MSSVRGPNPPQNKCYKRAQDFPRPPPPNNCIKKICKVPNSIELHLGLLAERKRQWYFGDGFIFSSQLLSLFMAYSQRSLWTTSYGGHAADTVHRHYNSSTRGCLFTTM